MSTKQDALADMKNHTDLLKRVIFITSFMLLLSSAFFSISFAGESGGPALDRKSADHILNEMVSRLGLTTELADQVRPILEEQASRKQSLFDKIQRQWEGQSGKQAFHQEVQDINSDIESQLIAILSPEQMEEYRIMCDEERQKKRGGRQRRF